MFSACLICRATFEANEELEQLPRGRRIAFDPGRGRLWLICRRCRRWSLVPMEARWEALEELERTVVDRARLLSRTDHIALLRAGPLEIVRVGGEATLPEESWWRYGQELVTRRERYKVLSTAGAVGVGALAVGGWAVGGFGFLTSWLIWSNQEWAARRITDGARFVRFGTAAWRGWRKCVTCGTALRSLPYRRRDDLHLARLPEGDGEDDVVLRLRCQWCLAEDGGLILEGREGERALRRVLAYHNHAGAREGQVRSASRLLEEAGSPARLRTALAGEGAPVGRLPRVRAVALEIAASEGEERRLLELEATELEEHWRSEEELASIIDGELTQVPLLESLRRRALGTSPKRHPSATSG